MNIASLPETEGLIGYSIEEDNVDIMSDTFKTVMFIYKNIYNCIGVSTEGIHRSSSGAFSACAHLPQHDSPEDSSTFLSGHRPHCSTPWPEVVKCIPMF